MGKEVVSPLRQRMIEDMNARKLGKHSQRGHIRSCKRWRGCKVNTISSCIVGVQRMIKNSKDHLAGRHPDAASHVDPAITQ